MKIAVIGTGSVGQTLAAKLIDITAARATESFFLSAPVHLINSKQKLYLVV